MKDRPEVTAMSVARVAVTTWNILNNEVIGWWGPVGRPGLHKKTLGKGTVQPKAILVVKLLESFDEKIETLLIG